jgi:hypothetical protein
MINRTMTLRTAITRRTTLALSLIATATVLGACATAAGPEFSKLEAAPAEAAHVYIYRKGAIYASAAAFNVSQDGKEVAKLFNASYLVLPVSPGPHKFGVDERGFTSAKFFEVNAQAGKSYFIEYDASKGWLLGLGLLSSGATQTESRALEDLKGLKRAN